MSAFRGKAEMAATPLSGSDCRVGPGNFTPSISQSAAACIGGRRGWAVRAVRARELPDGNVILVTHLSSGQRATVLQLPVTHQPEHVTPLPRSTQTVTRSLLPYRIA